MRSRGSPLRRARAALAAVCGLVLLASCTGTFEERPPTLLVVAFEDEAGPAVGLVKDTFNALEPGGVRALEFVTGSRRDLPAEAVSVDVVDRAGIRPIAVLLLRDPVTGTTYLRGFDIGGIDLASPTEFQSEPSFEYVLANAGPGGDVGLLELALADEYCPTELQVSEAGRFVALFEERAACGDPEFRAIYVIDLLAAAAGVDPVVERIVSPEPGAAGIYLDQEGRIDPDGNEALYFVDPGAGVAAYDVDTGAVDVLDVAGLSGVAGDLRDIGQVLDLLVLVGESGLFVVDATETALAAVAVDSASGLTELVQDPFTITEEAVLLAGDELVVHDRAIEPELATNRSAVPITGATLEPIDRFVYLLGDGAIGVFDLLAFDPDVLAVSWFAIEEIPSADVLTWARAQTELSP